MGLDISYYADAKPVPEAEVDSDGYPVDWTYVPVRYLGNDFDERADGLAEGIYSYGDGGGFRAGSYGGYNSWREELAEMAGYPAVEHEGLRHSHSAGAWASSGGPFYELIHFSDCEGVIGPRTSAKLAADFAKHQDKADAIGGYFAEKYACWRVAFETAARDGFVDFH